MLQDVEDNYYITAKYILGLANRAYELFISSEVEESRQLLKLVLSNLRVEGKKVQYDAVTPFDSILVSANSRLWLPLVDMFISGDIEFEFSPHCIEIIHSTLVSRTGF